MLYGRPKNGEIADAANMLTRRDYAPRFIHVNVSGTYSFLDVHGATQSLYFYKGLQYDASFMYGFPTATAGDITVIW